MPKYVFPNTEAYLINYLGGSSGAFISTIVYYFLNPKFNKSINISELGNAHYNLQLIKNTWHYTSDFDKNFDEIYKKIVPKSANKPFILFDHIVPDLTYFFSKFPKGKIIKINVEEKMFPRLEGNLFYKRLFNNDSVQQWNDYKLKHDFFQEFDSITTVPLSLIKTHLDGLVEDRKVNLDSDNYFSSSFNKEYKEIYDIEFYDVLYNKNKVLTLLSNTLNRPITAFIEQQYDIYLNKQNQFVKQYLPWINDV